VTPDELKAFYDRPAEAIVADAGSEQAHQALLRHLEAGRLRAAEPTGDGAWRVNAWVKAAILVGFRRGVFMEMAGPGWPMFDKSAYPPRQLGLSDAVRLVPGGSAVRRGAYVAPGVVVMPPAYVNVGAYIGAGSMVDSHALVGSCAQVGTRVHLSAGAQLGGVLEPSNAAPVVVEDDAFIGGLAGLFEGVRVRARAVIAAGVVLTSSTVIYDLVHGTERRREVPEGAVVVPGSRPASGDWARERGLSVAAPIIVKYRDAKTDVATALEGALR
jgi:2,3,4,5-tetrahydropyridine-2,6-dicarboxylate N-succinyltransferase